MTMITMMIKHVWWCPNSSLSEPIRVLQKTEKRKKNKVEGAQSSFTWSRLFRLQNLIYPLRKSRTFTTTNQNKNIVSQLGAELARVKFAALDW